MSLLTSLARAYDRLPDAPPYGFSTEKIAMLISVRYAAPPTGTSGASTATPGSKRNDDPAGMARRMP